jgi:nucleotide-binding universal stress UspA family protein
MLPTFDRILYCTQLGPNTSYVFRYAYMLAKKFGAELHVLHVVDAPNELQRQVIDGWAGEGVIEQILEEQEDEQLHRIPKRIAEFCTREIGDEDWTQVVTKIIVSEGRAHRQILEHVDSLKADLVVMGAHAESSLIERLMGNTAERVLQRSPVPVLICQVPEGKQALSLDL